MHLMWITTVMETSFFVCQCYVLAFPSVDDYCELIIRLPEVNFIPTCEGIIALFMSLNLLSLLIYWYFCAVTYEYYFIGCNDVYLKEHERKRIAKEKKKQIMKIAKEIEMRDTFDDDDSMDLLFRELPSETKGRKTMTKTKADKIRFDLDMSPDNSTFSDIKANAKTGRKTTAVRFETDTSADITPPPKFTIND